MNILLVNHYAGSPQLGMEFRPYYLASEWNSAGNKTYIVGGAYSHLRKKNPDKLGWDKIDGIDYLWLWTNKYKSNGLARFLSMLLFITQLLMLAPYLCFKLKPNLVIASSTYPLDIFPAWLIARLSGARLVFEIHDLWPLSPMELGGMSRYHPFIVIMRFAEWFAYKTANKIISILPSTFAHVKQDGVAKKNWFHVPNGIKPERNFTELPDELQQHINSKKDAGYFMVGYAGGMGLSNSLTTLIEAANLLKDEKIFFVLVGAGIEKQKLVRLSRGSNVSFFTPIPKDSVNQFLMQMDALAITWQKSPLYRFGISPNKIFDYMLAARPIIQAVEAGNDLVGDANCGLTVAPEDPKAIARAILDFSKMPKTKLEKLGKNGYDYVIQNHDYKKLAKDFLRYCCAK